jgi:hypothetical protein
MKTSVLIFEDIPKYDLWLKLILGGVLALTLILGVIFLYRDTEAAIATFGITVLTPYCLRQYYRDDFRYLRID